MIKQEIVNKLCHTYSDLGLKIQKVGTDEIYDEAYDINPCPYTYTETSEAIPPKEPTYEELKMANDILMGVER